MRAKDTVSEESKERTEQYFQILCRLLDMGMDINREITYSSLGRPKKAWRAALEQYDYFALTSYSTYHPEGDKAKNEQLQNWLHRILDVLAAHGASIYDFYVEDDSSIYNDDIDRIIRNMVFNRDMHHNIRIGTEHELKYCPQWFELKWRPIESILRPYYERENPYYGAEVSLERIPSLDKGTHGQKRVTLCPCFVTFTPRTSSTRRSSALQGHKVISFRLCDPKS